MNASDRSVRCSGLKFRVYGEENCVKVRVKERQIKRKYNGFFRNSILKVRDEFPEDGMETARFDSF
jgi:hypothetical protein